MVQDTRSASPLAECLLGLSASNLNLATTACKCIPTLTALLAFFERLHIKQQLNDTKFPWQVLQEHGNQFASFVELINVKIPYGNVQAFHQQV